MLYSHRWSFNFGHNDDVSVECNGKIIARSVFAPKVVDGIAKALGVLWRLKRCASAAFRLGEGEEFAYGCARPDGLLRHNESLSVRRHGKADARFAACVNAVGYVQGCIVNDCTRGFELGGEVFGNVAELESFGLKDLR